MAEEIGIVMSMYDKVSPTLKSISNNTKAFDKTMQELESTCKSYETTQASLEKDISTLKLKLVESSDKVRDATSAWRKHKSEMTEGTMYSAIAEQVDFKSKLRDTEAALNSSRKALLNYASDVRKSDNAAGGGSMMGQLAKAGLAQMAGDTLSGMANAFVGSAFGDEAGTMFSSALSGAVSGAALGSLAGPVGTAIGGAVGGALGLVNGGVQIFQKRDDAFKGYVQEQTEGQLSQRSTDIQSGSTVAAGREQDAIAFNTLLGNGVGDKYLGDLRTLAAKTPMEYSDLTGMSRSLATGFKDDPARMLSLMESVGNAGSAVGIDAGGMNMMATAMSRMQSSGKVTLEYLNLIQERGVNAVGMLADGMGKTQGEMYDLISKGKLEGVEAVRIIQDAMDEMYGGAMERQSQTFGGLSSTLADAQTEMQNAYGEGYNAMRKKGIEQEIAALSGIGGNVMADANRAIGAWKADLENQREAAIRSQVQATMAGAEYQQAKAEGDAAEMGRLIMEAKVKGQNAYNASDGAKLARESELSLAAAIREDASSNEAYWDAGLRKGQEYSKGLAAAINEETLARYGENMSLLSSDPMKFYDTVGAMPTFGGASSHAFGLSRVPKDNYPALLHRDERVLTANQARQQDSGGGTGGVVVNMYGTSVREEADVGKIAKAMAAEVIKARTLSVG